MSKDGYKRFCGDICRNFDKSWDKVGQRLDFAYEFLSHIPDHAWKQMIPIALRKWERWPSNWVKHVQELYREVPQENRPVVYDRIEDLRFPLNLMWDGFWILTKKGEAAFDSFCESVQMPLNDRDRVRNKHRVITSGEAGKYVFPEVGYRVNPKTDRPDIMPMREPGEEG